jgi:alkanesulfonate monooxygenase SsuD/methylene tetrahydromethanopterin reductase-like flavin-dependent oxidoreductase (luciferase family)
MKRSSASGIPSHPKDPITINPAPVGHPAYEAWERATREAEEKLFRFEAILLAERPPLGDDPGTWLIRGHVGTFQIWAERGLCIVLNHKDARAYEQWLEDYRKAYLKMLKENPSRGTVPDLLLAVLSDELLRAVRYWSANALEQVAVIEASRRGREKRLPPTKLNATSEPKPDESSGKHAGPPANEGDGDGTNRRAEVNAYIEEVAKTGKRITRTDIWKSQGYKSRTEFERWERKDPRATKTAHDRFTRMLAQKPHLK